MEEKVSERMRVGEKRKEEKRQEGEKEKRAGVRMGARRRALFRNL